MSEFESIWPLESTTLMCSRDAFRAGSDELANELFRLRIDKLGHHDHKVSYRSSRTSYLQCR
ncbi:MAG: hypothetical protein O6942_00480, partial [Bacteroidetes bacterium]|nr:hypothetical protein [Bacteroidota bacterium]